MAPVVETTRIAARVPAELVIRLEKIAEADDRTLSSLVRLALKSYADERELAKAS